MERYDYREALENDVREWLNDNPKNLHDEYNDVCDAISGITDELFNEDSVTGNASGSYTFSSWTAEEYLCHNGSLLQEALDNFDSKADMDDPEKMDVTIRCYLLGEIVGAVIADMWDDEENAEEDTAEDEEDAE